MILTRPSVEADVPRQRELWELAFGDSGPYVDNFYNNYYRPERVLVLEEDGVIQAMTAWFDTTFVVSEQEQYKAAYLYAVATHPDARGKGYAGRLLHYADTHLKEVHGFHAVTTVPAQPSLHNFFAANGFRECFTHNQLLLGKMDEEPAKNLDLIAINACEYGVLREEMLKNICHISYPADALEYQAGCCRLSGGGLYRLESDRGFLLLCAEGMEDGTLMLKELLSGQNVEKNAENGLFQALHPFGGLVRVPGGGTNFGMLKWLEPSLETKWDWSRQAYMGLGFD
jgi:GNAT superfamily N-acetyltransferase